MTKPKSDIKAKDPRFYRRLPKGHLRTDCISRGVLALAHQNGGTLEYPGGMKGALPQYVADLFNEAGIPVTNSGASHALDLLEGRGHVTLIKDKKIAGNPVKTGVILVDDFQVDFPNPFNDPEEEASVFGVKQPSRGLDKQQEQEPKPKPKPDVVKPGPKVEVLDQKFKDGAIAIIIDGVLGGWSPR